MRLKSSIFVSMLMRQVTSQGGFASVLNKGAEEAGAIFIAHLKSDRTTDLYGPAPQSAFSGDDHGERRFETLATNLDAEALSANLASQKRFDPDCWIVEIEGIGTIQKASIILLESNTD